jgi:PHD/YefM family antitoxin component YafN of YafNO toxin-antitoxin module
MAREMTVAEAQARLGEIVAQVAAGGEPVVIARPEGGRAMLVEVTASAVEVVDTRLAALNRLGALRQEVEQRRGGHPLPDAVELVRAGREERAARLDGVMGLR